MALKKVLFVANHKGFSKFNAPYMAWFKENGWQVDNASPGIETTIIDNQYDVDIHRSPFSLKNITAYKQLKKIINQGNYDIIHVHTPMGAVLGRLAAIGARKKGTKVIYTAHGFHFFKGAPIINWMLYYPIEKLLARWTDALVTINEEDYHRAMRHHLSNGKIYHIDGVGVNLERFHPISQELKKQIRDKLGLSQDDFVGLYVAQFIKRKNHAFIIEALPQILTEIPNFKMVFAGSGETFEYCKKRAKELGVSDAIKFLGGRSDIPDLCGMADIHISSSVQEGLAIGNIEAMACGCPLVISNIRGHKEVCNNNENGYLFNFKDSADFIKAIIMLNHDRDKYNRISKSNIEKANQFSIKSSLKSMSNIYISLTNNL